MLSCMATRFSSFATVFGLAVLAACNSRRAEDSKPAFDISSLKPAAPSPAATAAFPITLHNSLEGLTKGRLGAAASLEALPQSRGLVGIGSLSGLRGEIAIVNGETWVSYPDGEGARAERLEGRDELAAFLATSDVKAWAAEPLEHKLYFEGIPAEIERAVSKTNLDRARPVPILIEGEFSELKFNVVDGSALTNDEPSRQDMLETAKTVAVPRARGTLVGFYSQAERPELIHPGKRVHLHVVLPEAKQMGHLDAVAIEPGAQLRLPER